LGNPYAPYRVYRKAGGGNYSLVGETPMRLCLDTSATNGTAYTYKACVLNASVGEAVLFACKLKEPQRFRVDVAEDSTGIVVKTWTSPSASPVVAYEWDGTDMYGTGVEDDTYWVTITLIDKDPTIASRAKRVEVSLSGLGTVRFVAVNNMPGGPNSWGQRKLRAIRAACKAAGVSLKVFNRENAYWDDYGPDQDRPGVASFLQTSYIRAFYANTHGNHWLVDGQPRKPSTSFELRQWQPTLPGWAPGDAVISVNRQVMEPLNIREGRLRLVWLDACGTGRRNAGIIPTNIKDPASWRNVSDTYMNDLAHFGFRIRNPHVNIDPACYYMGYFGYGYVNEPYYDMVRLFFSRFSEQSGTLHTIGAVMTWLANQGAVTNDFAGPPYIEGDWLTVCPPFYNIRVFTDTWRSGIGKYYDGLKMSDLR
jgi:hypothetical protein